MDLSLARFDKDARVTALPADLAVMLVGIAARQAASPTAMFCARLAGSDRENRLLAPADGAFNAEMAALLRRWKEE